MSKQIVGPVAIYTRYSTDLQNDSSNSDQEHDCRKYLQSMSFDGDIVVYSDEAISGRTLQERPGVSKLMADIQHGRIKTVVVESVSRLSRSTQHLLQCHSMFNFNGCEIWEVAGGHVDDIRALLGGFVSGQQLKALSQSTRRGLEAVVRDGRLPFPAPYGYRTVAGEKRGLVEPDPDEVVVVRRIFQSYADGASPARIVEGLNAERIPGPRGEQWATNTINGTIKFEDGILLNRLYVGELVYSKAETKRHPETNGRRRTALPKALWTVKDVPHLAILDRQLFDAVQERRRQLSTVLKPVERRRPARLLSGLVRCGACGSPLTISSRDRFSCSAALRFRTCTNRKTILAPVLETRVLAGIKRELLSRQNLEAALDAYEAERAKLKDAHARRREQLPRLIAKVETELSNVVNAIAECTMSSELKEKLLALEEKRGALKRELANSANIAPPPADELLDRYRRHVDQLESDLRTGLDVPALQSAIRALICEVVVTFGLDGSEKHIRVRGVIGPLLTLEANKKAPGAISRGLSVAGTAKVGAGARFELTTFRL